jgi:hypothetical protein
MLAVESLKALGFLVVDHILKLELHLAQQQMNLHLERLVLSLFLNSFPASRLLRMGLPSSFAVVWSS